MNTKKCGIYKITNKINGKCYIGQSVDIESRWRVHKHNSKTQDGHLYRAIRKDGLDNFMFEVIVECDDHMLDEFEIGIIKLYDTTDRTKGYNLTFGGGGCRCSDETKKKISESKKGKTHSDETKNKMSVSQKGKTHSIESKNKMSASQKGKTHSIESKNKMSESSKKQYQYQGIVYNGMKELADFLGIKCNTLATRIRRNQINVIIFD